MRSSELEAHHELMYRALIAEPGGAPADSTPVVNAMRGTLRSNALDPAFKGEALSLPSEAMIGDRMELVDPEAIHGSRESLRRAAGTALIGELSQAQAASAAGDDLSPSD